MAIVSIDQIWSGRDGDVDRDGHRRYTSLYRVVTNDVADDAAVVRAGMAAAPSAGPGIQIGVAYGNDAGAYCQQITPRNESFSPLIWIVTCSFSSKHEQATDPTNDPIIPSWKPVAYKEVAAFDKDDEAILNSAGDYFPDPLMRDRAHKICIIEANMSVIPAYFLTLDDPPHINDADIILGACTVQGVSWSGVTVTAGNARINSIAVGKPAVRNGQIYAPVTFEIEVRKSGWSEVVLDRGFRKKDPSDATKRVAIQLDDGTLPSEPVLLDGAGAVLADPTPANAASITADLYPEFDFTQIPSITAAP